MPRPEDPQSLNRYAYARNSPLVRVDPSGHLDIPWNKIREAIEQAAEAAGDCLQRALSCLGAPPLALPSTYAMAALTTNVAEATNDAQAGALMAKGKAKDDEKDKSSSGNQGGSAGGPGGGGDPGKQDGKKVHKNSHEYVGETHVYRIKDPEGKTYKIGESAQGVRKSDGASIRAESQVRKLIRNDRSGYSSEIIQTFPDKKSAHSWQHRLIQTFRRIFGRDALPGNKSDY